MNAPGFAALLMVIPQVAAVLAVVFLCLPQLLGLLGLSFRNRVSGSEVYVEPDGTNPAHAHFHSQLLDLKFVPLGVYWEGLRFGKTFYEFAYTSPKQKCFAMISGLTQADRYVALL